jgi:hypothetical protein
LGPPDRFIEERRQPGGRLFDFFFH